MNRRKLASALAVYGVVCPTAMALNINAFISSAQDGDWSAVATWSAGEPTAVDTGDIGHTVTVTQTGEVYQILAVGTATNMGTVNISTGDLTGGITRIGALSAGTVNLSGGVWNTSSGFVISNSADGFFNVSGGTHNHTGVSPLSVGALSSGTMTVEGNGATLNISSTGGMQVGSMGALRIRPTANGPAGLSTINVTGGDVTFDAGSAFELDTSLYTPSAGDSWDIITFANNSSGTFTTLNAPGGVTISQSVAKAGVVTITVDSVSGPMPATNVWSQLALLGGLLVIATYRVRSAAVL